ncbi:uncharacterized protein L203_104504 [Cryptococcus depauperatus CBS 7841]|uniref:Uncharacterized protein n=1 Tax=Cryptococcus depauperatus CBS 7841 TaxID=1295531 RepID=A0AAJ8JVL1_9TREE
MDQETLVSLPLHIPVILQNPTNQSTRQVLAYNAQQREKVLARRDRESRTNQLPEHYGKGKKVIRRLDNAAFAENPHIVKPSKSDYAPPVPLQARPPRPLFPPGVISRSEIVPSATLPRQDPFSSDSQQGSFSTSLKGTRLMLRKRGKRAEGLVVKAEAEIRKWLDGDQGNPKHVDHRSLKPQWRVVDERLVDCSIVNHQRFNSSTSDRRLPPQHDIVFPEPPLENGQIPAVLEISRSPAHLSWHLSDKFERLVVHLLARYYELVSWSEDRTTVIGNVIRITHILIPRVTQPTRALIKGNSLETPETSEVSDQSSSENQDNILSGNESESDAMTERGEDAVQEQNNSSTANTVLTLVPEIADLTLTDHALLRTQSTTSSQYASSEGDSELSVLENSLALPRPPRKGSNVDIIGGWIDVDSDSDFDEIPEILEKTGQPSLTIYMAYDTIKCTLQQLATLVAIIDMLYHVFEAYKELNVL